MVCDDQRPARVAILTRSRLHIRDAIGARAGRLDLTRDIHKSPVTVRVSHQRREVQIGGHRIERRVARSPRRLKADLTRQRRITSRHTGDSGTHIPSPVQPREQNSRGRRERQRRRGRVERRRSSNRAGRRVDEAHRVVVVVQSVIGAAHDAAGLLSSSRNRTPSSGTSSACSQRTRCCPCRWC